jgi:hypothetical protein
VQEVKLQDRLAVQGLGFTREGVLEEAVVVGGSVSASEAGADLIVIAQPSGLQVSKEGWLYI